VPGGPVNRIPRGIILLNEKSRPEFLKNQTISIISGIKCLIPPILLKV